MLKINYKYPVRENKPLIHVRFFLLMQFLMNLFYFKLLIIYNEPVGKLHLKNELGIQIVPLVNKTAFLCTPFFINIIFVNIN